MKCLRCNGKGSDTEGVDGQPRGLCPLCQGTGHVDQNLIDEYNKETTNTLLELSQYAIQYGEEKTPVLKKLKNNL